VKHIVSENLEVKSDNCKFMRYSKESVGYYFYHPVKQNVFVLRYATFLDKKQIVLERSSERKIKRNEVQVP